MPFSVEGLTVEDFTESGWRDAIVGAEERECCSYRHAFYAEAENAHAAGDAKRENLFILLGDLASMFIDADDPKEPLKPMWRMGSNRTAIVSDFDPALPYLAAILPHIDDPELAARVGDVLWISKRDFKAARIAAESYLIAANLDDKEAWPDGTDRIERAIGIAAGANQRDLLDSIVSYVDETLSAFPATESSFLPARLMRLLQFRKRDDPAKYADIAKSFALSAEACADWFAARTYWDIQAGWHRLDKSDDGVRQARLRSAQTYVREAESRIAQGGSDGHMVAASLLGQALHVLRDLGGQNELHNELHARMLACQRIAVKTLGVISIPFDPSEMIAYATERVAGKSLYDAIFTLSLIMQPAEVARLREQAKRSREDFVFTRFAESVTVNAEGRTVARRNVRGKKDDEETQEEADLRAEMYKIAKRGQGIQGSCVAEAARLQILREHHIRTEDLKMIVQDSPFVPYGREQFFARGLQAGFHGDFETSTHFLVPQIEHAMRCILEQQGVITSEFEADEIQDVKDLNRMLCQEQFVGPLKEIFGEDLVFDLRGLLIERHGSNIRNDMAHGLLDYDEFHSGQCIYLWWLVLRLCCSPIIAALQAETRAVENEPPVAASEANETLGNVEGKDSSSR